ncbi:MAG: deoxyribodipyrimidine photo-lyase [Rhodospirillales bacterium]
MVETAVLVWLRQDLRLADNAALVAATERGGPVVPVYVLDDGLPGRWKAGGASRWWLHHSLAALATAIERRGGRLLLKRGPSVSTLLDVARETGAGAVFWNAHAEPYWRGAERELAERLAGEGIVHASFNGMTSLFPLGSIVGRSGEPLKVFTPFWRSCRAQQAPPMPLPAPKRLPTLSYAWNRTPLDSLALLPSHPDWADGLRECWRPGETAALANLEEFIDGRLLTYARDRDRPETTGTSRLSAHLHFGEISSRQVWHATQARAADDPALGDQKEAFLRELVWREFSMATLFDRIELADEPLQPRFRRFPWQRDERMLACWQRGLTGYPTVDAGMRQLWHSGWMHNRVRMIVASFLVRHLLQPWQDGEAWFWDTLVDADLANNAANWQWVAGCGRDSAPYFRIFNPVTQGQRFDPAGAYVRRWVPELARLPDRWVHRPWEAPAGELQAADVRLGIDYPNRLVEHSLGRRRALAAFESLKTER